MYVRVLCLCFDSENKTDNLSDKLGKNSCSAIIVA